MSTNSPDDTDLSQQQAADPLPPRQSSRREGNGSAFLYVVLVIWLVGAGVIYFTQRPQFLDHQIGNLITLVMGFVMLVSLLVWFCLQQSIPVAARLAVPLLLVAGVAVFFVFFKIVEVSGELIPKFASRFAPPADAQLEAPPPTTTAADLTTTTVYDFPQFLGPNRNLKYTPVTLAADWESSPPELLWKQPIGAGWGGIAAVNGYAVTLEQRGEEEMINCYEIATGKLAWSHSHPWRHETLMGGVGPRSTPTIDQGRVYAQGAGGMLFCLAGKTGEVIWQRNLLEEFSVSAEAEAQNIAWGRAGSPLVVADKVIVPAGGPSGSAVSLAAFDKLTGELVWTGGNSQISYASPDLATIGNVPQILITNESTVAGYDLETGAELWSFPWPGASNADASVSQTVGLPGDRVLISKGYGGGSSLLHVSHSGGQWQVDEQWHDASLLKTKFTNVVIDGENAYALSDGILEGVDLTDGERLWKKGRYGHGQILLVGNKLLVLAEAGEVHLLEIGSKRPTELGEFEAISGKTWNTMCLYGPNLLVRNSEEAACYRLPLIERVDAEQ